MKLQEELIQLVNDYRQKTYEDWLSKNQDLIKYLKNKMIEAATNGLDSIDINIVIQDDTCHYLKMWLIKNNLKYEFTKRYNTSVATLNIESENKYKLYISWRE